MVNLLKDLGKEKKNFEEYKKTHKLETKNLNEQARATASLQKTVELLVSEKLVMQKDLDYLHKENSQQRKESTSLKGTDSLTTRRNMSVLLDSVVMDKSNEAKKALATIKALNSKVKGLQQENHHDQDSLRLDSQVVEDPVHSPSQSASEFTEGRKRSYLGLDLLLIELMEKTSKI